jgi:hypothetical protein
VGLHGAMRGCACGEWKATVAFSQSMSSGASGRCEGPTRKASPVLDTNLGGNGGGRGHSPEVSKT